MEERVLINRKVIAQNDWFDKGLMHQPSKASRAQATDRVKRAYPGLLTSINDLGRRRRDDAALR